MRTRTVRALRNQATPQSQVDRRALPRVDSRSRCGLQQDSFPFAPSPRRRARAPRPGVCALSQRTADTRYWIQRRRNRYRKTSPARLCEYGGPWRVSQFESKLDLTVLFRTFFEYETV